MAQGKKSFVIYTGWKSFLDDLSDAQLGSWLKWVLDYTNDTNPPYPEDQAVRLACKIAQETLKRDLKKYEEKVERIKSARNQNPNNNKELSEDNNQTEIKLKSVKPKTEISSVNVNVNDNVNVNVLSNDNINNTLGHSTCEREALFDQFWKAYPKKIGKDKCKKWFLNKSRKVNQDLVDLMIDSISKWKSNVQWTKDNGQFIPHPYTWLNRSGWLDELPQDGFKSQSKTPIVWEEA